jgi:hypothetical protein
MPGARFEFAVFLSLALPSASFEGLYSQSPEGISPKQNAILRQYKFDEVYVFKSYIIFRKIYTITRKGFL